MLCTNYLLYIIIPTAIITVVYTSGWKRVLASSDTVSSHLWIVFLAPTYKTLLSIVISSLLCYILSVFEISFLGMGLRPSTYSEPFL